MTDRKAKPLTREYALGLLAWATLTELHRAGILRPTAAERERDAAMARLAVVTGALRWAVEEGDPSPCPYCAEYRRGGSTQKCPPHAALSATPEALTTWLQERDAKVRAEALGPLADTRTAPYVLAFAKLMEAKLAKNRHKGDRDGWLDDTEAALLERLLEEEIELRDAIHQRRYADVPGEAADVANFAMMIADVAGGLKP